MGRLSEVLSVNGVSSVELLSRNGEVGTDFHAKISALNSHIRNVRQHVDAGGPNLVAWPLLGWWEMPLWRHPSHKTLIIMHDPAPLARQHGLSPLAAHTSARLLGPKWPHLVTMSPEARSIAAKYFDSEQIHSAPHPMRAPGPRGPASLGRTVLVLGQCKPARDLDVMAAIAPALLAAGWSPTVAGRGWPPIPGWRVIDRFLIEGDFQKLLVSAAVVLLPYQHYFQSGVALRALECGLPVVGRETGFLKSVLGPGFPGAVDDWDDPGSWLKAIEEATASRAEQLIAATAYSHRGAKEWLALIEGPPANVIGRRLNE